METGALPIEKIARLVLREGQSSRPIYRVHRWFARRAGSQFRSLLAALSLPEGADEDAFWERYLGTIPLGRVNVLDPFVGGGTSLVEAARCGADVTGYDIDPVAASIARVELSAGALETLPDAAEEITQSVSAQVAPFHQTEVEGQRFRVLHHFWTQVVRCRRCDRDVELHPHYRLAYDRDKNVQWAFCWRCHRIQKISRDRKRLHCRACHCYTNIDNGSQRWNTVTCPHCNESQKLVPEGEERSEPPRWDLFAQEYLAGPGRRPPRRFKRAGQADHERFEDAAARHEALQHGARSLAPDRHVPRSGRLDRRPLIHGVERYTDLFNARQLFHLELLGEEIAALEDATERRLLGMAFSEHLTTNCMYTGYAFGYRRTSPLFSFHGYRHIVRPVELNPWLDDIGRGTFPNALRKIRRAIQFAREPYDLAPGGEKNESAQQLHCRVAPEENGATREKSPTRNGEGSSNAPRATIRAASSTDLSAVAESSVDLVLTDPPYFDNLNYSELSDFYLAWQQQLGLASGPYEDSSQPAPLLGNLAVSDDGEAAAEAYTDDLSAVFSELRRVLTAEGLCVFTYHHTARRAWRALGAALARSGLRCVRVIPMRGEGQGGLHSHDGTIRWDAVFVCRNGSPSEDGSVGVPTGATERAVQEASRQARRLSEDEDIGFRPPDELSLYRALLVSEATCGPNADVPLEDALAESYDPVRAHASV